MLSERAAAVVPDFAVDDKNAEAVLRLCRRLDGIPLALELAAVRLGALSLDQLNEGLAGSLSVLGNGNRGADARQQTLEATIEWSYGLLDEAEQLLWARLSVFAGGFDAAAAVEVCADERVPQGQMVELLGALVEKSIVRRELKSGNAPRYWLLETIRQFGRERLRDAGDEPRLQDRHLAWMTRAGPVGRGVRRSTGRAVQAHGPGAGQPLGRARVLPARTCVPRRAAPSLLSTSLPTGAVAVSSVTCGGSSRRSRR